MPTYTVAVEYKLFAEISVEAPSLEEAIREISNNPDIESDLVEQQLADGSWKVLLDETKALNPWQGWYIEGCEVSGSGLLILEAKLRHTNGRTETIEETLDPPFDRAKEVRVENFGGQGRDQQSILVTVSNGDVFQIQVEVDRETGTFKEESLYEWTGGS